MVSELQGTWEWFEELLSARVQFLEQLGRSFQTLRGGNISLFTELCEKTREDAFETMLAHAWELGANAVIGIRYDATEIMGGVSEVLCYGTAVVVEPLTIPDSDD